MTTPVTAEAASLEVSIAAERSRTLTLRLRLLIVATIGIVLMFIVGNPVVRSGANAPYLALRLTALLLLGGFLFATYRPGFARYQSFWGIVLASSSTVARARTSACARRRSTIVSSTRSWKPRSGRAPRNWRER